MATGAKRKLAEYRRKRDFSRTPEPSGGGAGGGGRPKRSTLRFVIQKHAASHLHFDFRLELGGVMKSWAVPKGPSLDPAVKRLAMEVEDHPIDYNTFEGTIPKGQYGGGTVMLWDRGTYDADEANDEADEEVLRREYRAGKMSFTLHGERLRGSFTLIRTRGSSDKPQWLLMKHRDKEARPGSDIVAEVTTSVDTGRTMDEIASGTSRVWQSNRASVDGAGAGTAGRQARRRTASAAGPSERTPRRAPSKRAVSSTTLEPMYATVGNAIPSTPGWTFEPKYDGIRVLAFVTERSIKLITRNGKEKTKQFPEIVDALHALQERIDRPVVLDGEIVAFTNGTPARFQELQARMHVKDVAAIGMHAEATPARLVMFDLLLDGDDVLLHEPWSERRRRLERLWGKPRRGSTLVLTDSIRDDGEGMVGRAHAEGWEGVIAKRVDARYEPGARSRSWLKLKIEHRQEFVIGGYTEPRNTREHIGALLLGYFDNDRFLYVGHTGGGFTREGLKEMYRRLAPLERRTSPFEETPATNERAHWVTPKVVVEVKFNEWTADGKLRQPIYLGTRDDKDAREVGREPESIAAKGRPSRGAPSRGTVRRHTPDIRSGARATAKKRRRPAKTARRSTAARRSTVKGRPPGAKRLGRTSSVIPQLARLEETGSGGVVDLGRGAALQVSSLDKVFFPKDGYTKGDLMRYYAEVAPALLPAIEDRPLVLKRFPNGINGTSFYQQKAPDEAPDIVRVETIHNEEGTPQRRLIGGDLATLLYTVQLGAISVDPWHGRAGALEYADYTILDLDPGPRATFARVVEVAGMVKEVMDSLDLRGIVKTSGSSGIHVVVPLPPKTPEEAALLVAQLIATRVAEAHPREATIERSVKARPPAAVYVDYLQNIRSKTVASVYAVRARPGATVSTPLQWDELRASLDPREFTIATVPSRLAAMGDLWGRAMRTRNSLRGVLETAGRPGSARGSARRRS